MNDIKERRERNGTDEQGRQQINAHGDVDVVRTESNYPVQVPIEPGDYLRIDDEEFRVGSIRGNQILLDKSDEGTIGGVSWGVHAFNTAVRDADEVVVKNAFPDDEE